jgi:hypothetical protein
MRPRGAFHRLCHWMWSEIIAGVKFTVSCTLAVAVLLLLFVLAGEVFVLQRDGAWRPISIRKLLDLDDVATSFDVLGSLPATLVLLIAVVVLLAVRRWLRALERRRAGSDREIILDDMERAFQSPS